MSDKQFMRLSSEINIDGWLALLITTKKRRDKTMRQNISYHRRMFEKVILFSIDPALFYYKKTASFISVSLMQADVYQKCEKKSNTKTDWAARWVYRYQDLVGINAQGPETIYEENSGNQKSRKLSKTIEKIQQQHNFWVCKVRSDLNFELQWEWNRREEPTYWKWTAYSL